MLEFSGEQLSDPDLYKIWDAYDVDGNGKMDRDELFFLMEDLCEVRPNTVNILQQEVVVFWALGCNHSCMLNLKNKKPSRVVSSNTNKPCFDKVLGAKSRPLVISTNKNGSSKERVSL